MMVFLRTFLSYTQFVHAADLVTFKRYRYLGSFTALMIALHLSFRQLRLKFFHVRKLVRKFWNPLAWSFSKLFRVHTYEFTGVPSIYSYQPISFAQGGVGPALPWPWCAPETLRSGGVSTIWSDTWMYGMFMSKSIVVFRLAFLKQWSFSKWEHNFWSPLR